MKKLKNGGKIKGIIFMFGTINMKQDTNFRRVTAKVIFTVAEQDLIECEEQEKGEDE